MYFKYIFIYDVGTYFYVPLEGDIVLFTDKCVILAGEWCSNGVRVSAPSCRSFEVALIVCFSILRRFV